MTKRRAKYIQGNLDKGKSKSRNLRDCKEENNTENFKVEALLARLTKPHTEKTQISDRRMKQGITRGPIATET